MRDLVRRNSAFSSLRCSRVHTTAAAGEVRDDTSLIGVDPGAADGANSLIAVDGDAGVVSILRPGGTSTLPSHDDARATA
jgi:hypothetical protein